MKHTIALLALILSITACTPSMAPESQQVKTEQYFGRSSTSGDITDAQWEQFRDEVLKEKFSGYTELDADGYWTGTNNESVSEKSKVIIYLHENRAEENAKIDSVKSAYKTQFDQESVLEISTIVEAEF